MKYEFTLKEKILYVIWYICGGIVKPFHFIGNKAVDKLNKSYYKHTRFRKAIKI